MRIGIVGPQSVSDAPTTAWTRAALNQLLGEHLHELVGITGGRSGVDQMFGDLIRERGGRLDVIPVSPAEASQKADLRVISRCDLTVIVSGGSASRQQDERAALATRARGEGRVVVVVDPALRQIDRGNDSHRPGRAATLDEGSLDAARKIGDPILDPIVRAFDREHGPAAVGGAIGALFRTRGLPSTNLLIDACGEALGDLALGDPLRIARGQQLFALFGPEIFLVLGSCSLPLAFAAGHGVQAIYRARRLKDDPVRRLFDTAQMIINVMQVGTLDRGQLGWRTARKVRLIHALIRQHVQSDPAAPWSEAWGTPINQEDLAGTLLSFSVAVLHGLRRMGARLLQEEADAYVYAWSAIGRMLGVDEALLTDTEEAASRLATRIGNRQIRATPEGKILAAQLMEAVGTLFPVPGYANSLTHFFLADTAFGRDVARVLELPPPGWTRALVAVRAWQKRKVLALLPVVPGARRRRSYLARRFVQAMILMRRPEGTAPFEIPGELANSWRLNVNERDLAADNVQGDRDRARPGEMGGDHV